MVLFLIPPVFTAVSVYLVVHPTKDDPLYPDRKRRDWPVIIGLFAGGMAAYWLWLFLMDLFVLGKMKRFRALNQTMGDRQRRLARGATWSLGTIFYLTITGVLIWQMVDEATLRPKEDEKKRSARATAKVVGATASTEVPGYQNVTLSFVTPNGKEHSFVERNLTTETVTPGATWTLPVRYDPLDPLLTDATVRPYQIFTGDLQTMGACVAVMLLVALGPVFLW